MSRGGGGGTVNGASGTTGAVRVRAHNSTPTTLYGERTGRRFPMPRVACRVTL
jgi:hypothetical protein